MLATIQLANSNLLVKGIATELKIIVRVLHINIVKLAV